jgi:hypothetical protein
MHSVRLADCRELPMAGRTNATISPMMNKTTINSTSENAPARFLRSELEDMMWSFWSEQMALYRV